MKGAAALELKASRPIGGRVMFMDNMIDNCSHVVKAADERMWEETIEQGNTFIDYEVTHE